MRENEVWPHAVVVVDPWAGTTMTLDESGINQTTDPSHFNAGTGSTPWHHTCATGIRFKVEGHRPTTGIAETQSRHTSWNLT